jgi:hypothetical protein
VRRADRVTCRCKGCCKHTVHSSVASPWQGL